MRNPLQKLAVIAGLAIAGSAAAAPAGQAASADTMAAAIQSHVARVGAIAERVRASGAMSIQDYMSLTQALLGASPAQLDAAAAATSYKEVMNAIRASRPIAASPAASAAQVMMLDRKGIDAGATKALGNTTAEFVFYPVVPCRLFDSRSGGTPLAPLTPRGVDFDGGNPGNAAGCTRAGLASQIGGTGGLDRAAFAINLTVTQGVGAGFIQVRPVGSTNITSNQNFTAGQDVANMAVVQSAGAATSANEFELMSSVSVHAIVDVLGVFAPPVATAVECVNQTIANVTLANGEYNSFAPACPAGYTVTGGGVFNQTATDNGQVINASAPCSFCTNTNAWYTALTNNSGTSGTYTFFSRCCRVPGR